MQSQTATCDLSVTACLWRLLVKDCLALAFALFKPYSYVDLFFKV